MKLNATLFCLFFNFLLYGQYYWTKGSILLKNGETIEGFIKLSDAEYYSKRQNSWYKEIVRFRPERKGRTTKYDETQVDRILLNYGDTAIATFRYISIFEKRKNVLEEVFTGRVTLYKRLMHYSGGAINGHSSSSGYMTEYFFTKEGQEGLIVLHPARAMWLFTLKKRSLEHFGDCESVARKIEEGTYNVMNLEEMVKEYNNCF